MCVFPNMPFTKKNLFEQSQSVDLCTENRVLFFEENWNLKVKAVPILSSYGSPYRTLVPFI